MHPDRSFSLFSAMRFITSPLKRPRIILFVLAGITLLIIVVPPVLRHIGSYLIVSDPIHRADVLVPLAGDPARVRYAAQMVNRGDAQWLLITNMAHAWNDPANVYSTRTSREAGEYGVSPERIFVAGQPVSTTYEEALVIRDFVEDFEWQSLIVVTSPSHTRRSRIIFRDVFQGSNVEVMIVPVENHWYTSDTWWRRQDGWRETMHEYLKLVLYRLGYR
jgi:uncharacterized SAM-binding protein YcdF (DUF218 family)